MSWACEFRCAKSLDALDAALNQAGPWSWQARDSYGYGDYLNSRPLPKLRVRIHENGAGMLDWWAAHRQGRLEPDNAEARRSGEHHYRVQVDMDDGCAIERTAVDDVLSSLLPVVGARDIREIAAYD